MIFWSHVKATAVVAAAGLVLAGTGVVAARQLAVGAPGAPAVQPPVPSGGVVPTGTLSVAVRADKPSFRADERLRFVVTFRNATARDVPLDVTDYLGTATAGKYTARLRNVATGEDWSLWQNPAVPMPGAPARLRRETLKPGAALDLAYVPFGWFAPGRGAVDPARAMDHLPPGDYTLALGIEANGMTLAPSPAPFAVVASAAVPLSLSDTSKALALARAALAQRLARQVQAEKASGGGGGLPGGVSWSTLTADLFTADVQRAATGTAVKFRAPLPGGDRVVIWSVHVGENGVDPNAGMQGFVVQSASPAPVPAVVPLPARGGVGGAPGALPPAAGGPASRPAAAALVEDYLGAWVQFAQTGKFYPSPGLTITEDVPAPKPGVWARKAGTLRGMPIAFEGDTASESRRVIVRSFSGAEREALLAAIRKSQGAETSVSGGYHAWTRVSGGPKVTDQSELRVTLQDDLKAPGTLLLAIFSGPHAVR